MKTFLTIAAIMLATTAHASKPNDNGPCTTGNAIFCGIQGETGPAGPAGPQGPQGEAGPKGDAGPAGPQGEAGRDGIDGATGATGATGAAGRDGADGAAGRDGIDGADGADGAAGATGPAGADGAAGADGPAGRDGQDFDASGHAAALASSTAIGSLQIMDPFEGEITWSIGLGGQFDGDSAIAAGVRYGFTGNLSAYASIATSLDGAGTSYGVGMSGRF